MAHLLPRFDCQLVRNSSSKYTCSPRIRGSDDARRFCEETFEDLANAIQETFAVVLLDNQNKPIGRINITTGTLDASLVHPREVFRAAIVGSASCIILVHNHPSGDCTPSREDRAVTTRLVEVGDLVGIRVLDHIIVGFDEASQKVVSSSVMAS